MCDEQERITTDEERDACYAEIERLSCCLEVASNALKDIARMSSVPAEPIAEMRVVANEALAEIVKLSKALPQSQGGE